MTYRERPTAVPGAILWERAVGPAAERQRILPDGCMDVLWDGGRLFVAGPDSTARWHESGPGTAYVALRLSGGLGPALLGVPADVLRDQTPDLEELWGRSEAAALADRVASDPAGALETWMAEQAARREVDTVGPVVLGMARAGTPVTTMAERLGFSARHLHRRCLPVFGYGPRLLTRVLRMRRALAAAGAGRELARVAADCGYADQAHLCREVRALAGTTPGALVRELALR